MNRPASPAPALSTLCAALCATALIAASAGCGASEEDRKDAGNASSPDAAAGTPDLGDPSPDPDGAPGDAGTCPLQSFAPATTRCGPATAPCLSRASTPAARQACWQADPGCASCLDDSYDHCVIGTPQQPGRCARDYACAIACVVDRCGPDPDEPCVAAAVASACAELLARFEDCWDPDAPANERCSEQAIAGCFPPPVCGNGVVEPGELCDGDCPTSCAQPGDPCSTATLVGSPSTCDAHCVVQTDPSCSACPKNTTASTQLGGQVFSGSFMTESDRFYSSGVCPMYGRDAVHLWQAPATGLYDFSSCSLGEFAYFGDVVERSSCLGELTVLAGTQCVAGLQALGCTSYPSPKKVRLSLNAGERVLVVASRSIDTDSSDGVYDLTAPYWISIEQCQPSCAGKSCGDDGCGGSCGACSGNTTCSPAGQCVCQPSCAGKSCGDDGCGGSCGTCSGNATCSPAGQCVCQPSCAGKTCGGDGCGGSCGTCSTGFACISGNCYADPDSCDPVDDVGCASGEGCWLLSDETTACSVTGTGIHGSTCASTSSCAGGHACFSGTCRKICALGSGRGCTTEQTCQGVSGWSTYGACN